MAGIQHNPSQLQLQQQKPNTQPHPAHKPTHFPQQFALPPLSSPAATNSPQSIPSPAAHNFSQQLPSHPNSASKPTGSSSLNPRSCITCRKRKVKCNKEYPCSNCVRGHTECKFPAPGRAPRRPRKPPDGELLARLRKLESVVQSLGANANGDAINSPRPREGSEQSSPESSSKANEPMKESHVVVKHEDDANKGSVDSSMGRLVLDEGRSRFISNSYYANLSDEVENIRGILHGDSDEDNENESPVSTPGSPTHHHGFVFDPHHMHSSKDLHSLHPSAKVLDEYWRIFEENVDPLTKMLHLPSTHQLIQSAKENPTTCTKSNEALLFAIYFSTITSISAEECDSIVGESKSTLLHRYRWATEHALARANFLITEEIVVLQALCLFMVGLRRYEDPRMLWSLTGLVVRIATTLGLHRDPTNFGLSPFDTEIRRRLWWQVCNADVRLSEDHGSDPTILEHTYDTKYPLNIDDSEFHPNMGSIEDKEGVTDMTFSLIRFKVAMMVRRLNYCPPCPANSPVRIEPVTIKDKENWIEECHQHMESKYLKYCDMNKPMHWVICTISRLILAKMWLTIYQPFQRLDGGASLPQKTRDQLFITSLESVEYGNLLQNGVRTVKWGWLFKTYSQWHALAFLLSELCHRTKGQTVVRAWKAVDATVAEQSEKVPPARRAHLWRPLQKLMEKARAAREREVALDDNLATPAGQPKAEESERTPDPFTRSDYGALDRKEKRQNLSSNISDGEFGPSDSSRTKTGTTSRTGTTDSYTTASSSTENQEVNKSDENGSSNNPSLDVTDFGWPLTNEASMPDLQPTASRTMFDVADNDDFAASPFFVNQPPSDPAQWTDCQNVELLNDFIGGDVGPVNNPYLVSGNPQQMFQPQVQGELTAQPSQTFGSYCSQPSQPSQREAQQQAQQRFSNAPGMTNGIDPNLPDALSADDPMVTGTDEPTLSWEAWDELVRNLEMETAASGQFQQEQPFISPSGTTGPSMYGA